MSKVAVVYWSGTGNTETMAGFVESGAKAAGAEVTVYTASEFTPELLTQFDAVAFGCPSMGADNWKKANSNPCSQAVKPGFPAKESPFSALMAGATANGCAPGKRPAKTTAPFWCATASSAVKRRTTRPKPPAKPWARRLPDFLPIRGGFSPPAFYSFHKCFFCETFSIFSYATENRLSSAGFSVRMGSTKNKSRRKRRLLRRRAPEQPLVFRVSRKTSAAHERGKTTPFPSGEKPHLWENQQASAVSRRDTRRGQQRKSAALFR